MLLVCFNEDFKLARQRSRKTGLAAKIEYYLTKKYKCKVLKLENKFLVIWLAVGN
jgi:hypothetical protein